jgi:hypothetical protein
MSLHVRVAGTGNLLVEDHRRNRVAVVTPQGEVLYLAPGASRAVVLAHLRCSGWL